MAEGLKPAAVVTIAAQPAVTWMREKSFFERLEALRSERRWAEAAQAIREVRVATPGWFAAREADLLEWQMIAALQLGDTPELLSGARFCLDGSGARALRAVNLAQELGETGNRSDAELRLTEVLRKSPLFPPAMRLLKAWHPPAVPAAESKAKR